MVSSQFFSQISERVLAFFLLYNRIISSIAKEFAEMDDECSQFGLSSRMSVH